MAFHKYPYTDQHEINLDWFLGQFKKLVSDFKKLETEFKDLESDIVVVPIEVRQAIYNLLNNNAFANDDTYINDLAIVEAWATESIVELTSISAVYTQSGTVYETDSLDTLKNDLIVTALYDNGTSQTVTAYTLSGTLTVGTSTITVSYGGKSTSFNVTVSAAPSDTTVEISQYDKRAIYQSTADNIEKANYVSTENCGVTIVYELPNATTSFYPAGILPFTTNVFSTDACIFALDADGNHVNHVNQYNSSGRWAQNASGTLEEFKQEWTIGLYSKVFMNVDIRHLDDSYMYDYTTGQIWFAGINTPYYGMSNVSEAE